MVIVGLETSETLVERYGGLFELVDLAVQTVFVGEIVIRLLAHWPGIGRFFRDGWNVFDLAVVAASLLPQAGAFAMVARLARLMRVTRLISVFPELRLIVSTMLRSIPSMGHILMMLGLLLYVYGILGFYLFREQDPERWGTLGAALLTLFQMLTLEGWVEVQAAVLGEPVRVGVLRELRVRGGVRGGEPLRRGPPEPAPRRARGDRGGAGAARRAGTTAAGAADGRAAALRGPSLSGPLTLPSPLRGEGREGYRRGVRPSRSSSGMRPLMRSATIRAVPHAIVQPMCPWPQLKKRLR